MVTMPRRRQRRSTAAQPNRALRRQRRQARSWSQLRRSQGALCAAPWLLHRLEQHRACRLPRRRAGFSCATMLHPCLMRVIVINRDSTRRTSSTFLEQLVVKAVRAVPRQYMAGLVRTAAFLGLLLELVALLSMQTLFCNQTTLCSCCLLYTSPSPRDKRQSRMPSSA